MIDTNLGKIGIFRGVPFRYREINDSLGKEIKVVRYVDGPFYDVKEPSTGPKTIKIQAIFIGIAADIEKILFMQVAALPGAGLLIHPDFGVSMAYCVRADVSKDGAIGGRVAVDCEFLPSITYPYADIAFAAAIAVRDVAIRAAALVRFTAGVYVPAGSTYESATKADGQTATAAVDAAMVGVLTGPAYPKWQIAVSNVSSTAAADMGTYFQGLADIVDTVDAALAGLQAARSAWVTAAAQATSGAGYAVEASNRAVLYETMAVGFLRRACRLAIDATYPTYDDAAVAAKAVYAAGRAVIEMMAAPEMISKATDILGMTVQGMAVEALKLPLLIDYETPAPVSTLELAWSLYGDIGRADEIARNNGIVDPGVIDLSHIKVLTK